MKNLGLSGRFNLGLAVISALLLGSSLVSFKLLSENMKQTSQAEVKAAQQQTTQVTSQLSALNDIYLDRVKASIGILRSSLLELGHAELKDPVEKSSVPTLVLGKTVLNNSFDIVDRVKEFSHATATIFVKNGDSFTRVTTNVLKADGQRAIGTELDKTGNAYAAIKDGKGFYGFVNILGKPYITGYEPLFSENKVIVGAYYVGFDIGEINSLADTFSKTQILGTGFLALLNEKGKLVFGPQGRDAAAVEAFLDAKDPRGMGWEITQNVFKPWGYTLLSAYSTGEVEARTLRASLLGQGLTVSVLFAVFIAAIFYIRGLVAKLKSATQVIKESFGTVADVATTLRKSSQQAVGRSEKQSHHVHQGVSSFEEIQSMTVRTAEDAKRGTVTAEECQEKSKEALLAAQDLKQSMDEIAGSKKDLDAICTLMDEIEKKTALINDIVFKTTLLSFNASIEAARAGQHGRGFAVVAEEVGSLAVTTGQAAKEVNSLLQKGKAQVQGVVRDLDDKVTRGELKSENCLRSFQSIFTVSQDLREIVLQISQAAHEQNIGISQAQKAFSEIQSLTAGNVAQSKEIDSDSEVLLQEADKSFENLNNLQIMISGKLAS